MTVHMETDPRAVREPESGQTDRNEGCDKEARDARARLDVPDAIVAKWQRIVDLMARTVDVPAALIMRVDPPQVEVFVSSAGAGNPYKKGEGAQLDNGL